jgi:hypothetical protein
MKSFSDNPSMACVVRMSLTLADAKTQYSPAATHGNAMPATSIDFQAGTGLPDAV